VGSYTTTFKLYKPDPTEFVDPDVHINNNLNTVDKALKRLLEYEYSNDAVPDVVDSVDRARFYKSYSNSVTAYFRSGNFFYQDPTAFVSTWTRTGSLLSPGFFEHPDFPVAYRIIRKASAPTTAEIEWTGALWNNGNVMDLNVNVGAVMTLPALAIPTVTKYFTMWSGNTAANYSIGRVGFFTGSNDLQYKRYGQDPSSPSDECRIELTGIKYNIEVAA
jgi:hypothetical protein